MFSTANNSPAYNINNNIFQFQQRLRANTIYWERDWTSEAVTYDAVVKWCGNSQPASTTAALHITSPFH